MKYKIVYQFRWLLILWLIVLIYISNFVQFELPFVRIGFPKKDFEHGLFFFLLSFLPKFNIEFYSYNIQTILSWSIGIIFGSRTGLITLIIYLFVGFFIFPIFAGGGGIDYYKEPTFGYLISLPFLAYLSGWFYEKNKKFLAIIVPIFLIHACGIIYLLFLKQTFLDIAWHLSFSMISYDLILSFILSPFLPFLSFILNEVFIQEIPAKEFLVSKKNNLWK